MRTICAVLFCIMVVPLSAASPASEPPDGYEPIVDAFFSRLQEGKVDDAVDQLYASNPWMARSEDAVQQIKSQLGNLKSLVGEYASHDLIVRKTLGGRLVYLNYLVSFDRQPLRFEFQFYRPRDKWMTYSSSFDDEVDEDLERQGRLESVRE